MATGENVMGRLDSLMKELDAKMKKRSIDESSVIDQKAADEFFNKM